MKIKKGKRKNRSRRIKRQKEEVQTSLQKREEGGLYNHTVQYTLKYSQHYVNGTLLSCWAPLPLTCLRQEYVTLDHWPMPCSGQLCWCTATKIPFMYFFSGNCVASVSSSTFRCLWAFYIFPGSVHIFPAAESADGSWEYKNRSQTHECGNWDWGRAVPWKGMLKWDFHRSVKWWPFLQLCLVVWLMYIKITCFFIWRFSCKPQTIRQKTSSFILKVAVLWYIAFQQGISWLPKQELVAESTERFDSLSFYFCLCIPLYYSGIIQ